MKTYKTELTENSKIFSNNDDYLECFFSEKLNKFCLLFNSKLFTYKTYNGFLSKKAYFVKKYNLTQTN